MVVKREKVFLKAKRHIKGCKPAISVKIPAFKQKNGQVLTFKLNYSKIKK